MNFGILSNNSRKNIFLLFLLFWVGTITGFAQTDSLVFDRQGKKKVIELKKVKNLEQLKTISGVAFPMYAMPEKELLRLKNIIDTYIKLELEYDKLKSDFHQKDSIYAKKTGLYIEMDCLQRMRASNYEQAYLSLFRVNEQLDAQLKNCEKLAKSERCSLCANVWSDIFLFFKNSILACFNIPFPCIANLEAILPILVKFPLSLTNKQPLAFRANIFLISPVVA